MNEMHSCTLEHSYISFIEKILLCVDMMDFLLRVIGMTLFNFHRSSRLVSNMLLHLFIPIKCCCIWGASVAHRVECETYRLSPDRSDPGLNPARVLCYMSFPLSPILSSLSHSKNAINTS